MEGAAEDDIARAQRALLDALRRLAPEVEVDRLAPDQPLREQVELDSMDWLNLADAVAEATGRSWPADTSWTGATLASLAATIAAAPATAPSAPAAGPGAYRSNDGRPYHLRPLRADDAPLDDDFVRRLSSDSRYQRFMTAMREMPPAKLESLTHIDQEHHLAIVAATEVDGREQLVGVARSIAGPGGDESEFAIAVADDWQGSGVAGALMRTLIAAARAHGVRMLYGIVLSANRRMLGFVRRLGFEARADPDDRRLVRVQRRL